MINVKDTIRHKYDDSSISKKFYNVEDKSLNNSGNEPTSPDHYKGG